MNGDMLEITAGRAEEFRSGTTGQGSEAGCKFGVWNIPQFKRGGAAKMPPFFFLDNHLLQAGCFFSLLTFPET